MQRLTWQFDRQFAAAAVGGVPQHRMNHVRAIHLGLMGVAGIKLKTQQRIIAESFLESDGTKRWAMTPRKPASEKLMTLFKAFAISDQLSQDQRPRAINHCIARS